MKVFAESRSRGKEFARHRMSWSLMRLKMNQLVMWLRRKAGRLWGLFVMYIWCRPRCLNLVTTSWMSEWFMYICASSRMRTRAGLARSDRMFASLVMKSWIGISYEDSIVRVMFSVKTFFNVPNN